MAAPFIGCTKNAADNRLEVLMSRDQDSIETTFSTIDDANASLIYGGNESYWTTPLHVAVEAGDINATRHLLSVGASPNAPNDRGRTPLFCLPDAASQEDLKTLVEILVNSGAKVDQREPEYDFTPLLAAAVEGDAEAAAALALCGADVEAVDRLGRRGDEIVESLNRHPTETAKFRKIFDDAQNATLAPAERANE